MKKIIVVGGGITGCIIASFLANKKFKVEIYEKSDRLGGVLSDVILNNGKNKEKFLSGPQYVEINKLYNDYFCNEHTKKYLKKIKLKYASYTDIFNNKKSITHKNFALPITDKKFLGIKKFKNNLSLLDRFNSYQKNVNDALQSWTKNYFHDLDKLHHGCVEPSQTGRVYFINDKKKLQNVKKKNKYANNLLGIPKKENRESYVPLVGYNEIFDIFEKNTLKNVKIFYNSKIKIKKNLNLPLNIYYNNKKLSADYYVWACNPVTLIRNAYNKNLDNAIVKISTFYFNIVLRQNIIKDIYFQVFSKKFPINRIYIYQMNKKIKVNVECFYRKELTYKNVVSNLKTIFNKFNINKYKLNFITSKNEIRHILVTKNDYKLFKKFNNDKKFYNIIPGGWELYSRDAKLSQTIKFIKKRILI